MTAQRTLRQTRATTLTTQELTTAPTTTAPETQIGNPPQNRQYSRRKSAADPVIMAMVDASTLYKEFEVDNEEWHTPERATGYGVYALYMWERSENIDMCLYEEFKADFEGWTSKLFGLINSTVRKAIKKHLTHNGVYLPKAVSPQLQPVPVRQTGKRQISTAEHIHPGTRGIGHQPNKPAPGSVHVDILEFRHRACAHL
ncbi:hypothetical protein SEPCBS119000_005252 [Sporothrix epigloea]|uniref:Uncharacterized protein n=1 Tax=Sporothrix epigloea TaxID=1892477 RepID=A0ABP0DYS5_9PEZI